MAGNVRQRKHNGRDTEREEAAAFWQRAVDAGRILRMSGTYVQQASREERAPREEKAEERTASPAP